MSQKSYQGTLDRFEGKLAVIKLTDGTEVLWPIKNLNEEAEAGARIKITFAVNPNEQAEKEGQAKAMLNDILNVPKNSE